MPVGQAETLLMVEFDCVRLLAAKAMIGRCSKSESGCRIVDDAQVGTLRDGAAQRIRLMLFWARVLGKLS